jgi:uroporphyrinogen III methyltransferase / synthase
VSETARRGAVYLVGAGPGDPGLLTVRARELLARCDAVVYDALANPKLLTIATERADRPPATLHDAGKRGGAAESARQEEISALLVRLGREGQSVVRLKGGDPFVFGRGSEEAQALAEAGIHFEVVPGVTAGIAAPAYAGIPVTHRGLSTSVTFVTGHEDPAKETTTVDWSALARSGGTIVLYMGVKSLPRIAAALVAGGMSADTPAAAVEWGTYPRQRAAVATLSTLSEVAGREGIASPVITVIGSVVSLREQIGWFDTRPMHGRRIVVTRAKSQAASLSDRLAALGAEVLEMPAIRIERLDATIPHSLAEYGWVVFTSQNAVGLFWEHLRERSLDSRALAGVKVAAVGPATAAALAARGITVDISPRRFVAEELLDVLGSRPDVRGARVLHVSAEGAREVLREGLINLGAVVDSVPLYRAVTDGGGAAELRARIEAGEVDLVTFTSGSSVASFIASVGADAARRLPAASIGPITSEAARSAGIDIVAEASASTIDGLVEAVSAHFERGAEA